MYPRGPIKKHPAYSLLLQYATTGCPVDCGRDWTRQELQAAVTRGSHPSAKDPAAATACRKEALERVKDGCCNVIRWSQLQKACPTNLKVSPIAAIPHKSRAFRMILDLSFSLRTLGTPIPAVNDASDKSLAPHHAMYELGNVIPRLVHAMATTTDHTTPFMYTKVDLKDGYWRMVVNPGDAYNFAYVLPPAKPTTDPELVIPESLQMGWSESPAFFCAATETARDEAHRTAFLPIHFPAHQMEDIIMAIDWTKIPATFQDPTNPLTIIEVYLDDFIIMTQSTQEAYLRHLTRCLLYAIENVFPGPDITGSAMGPAISKKKLQEEGTWDTVKEILGWEFDGLRSTITLPPAKATKIIKSIQDIRRKHWIPLKDFQKVHGRLQHTAIVIPCGKPLMGPLDSAIATTIRLGNPNVKLTPYVKSVLNDWIALIHQAAARPTHVKELIPHKPSFHGFVDASGWGVGGVWFSGTKNMAPTVWFLRWPSDITDNLVTDTNPAGSISISDLELAGIVLHFLALEALLAPTQHTLRHATVAIWCDNLAAVAWAHKNRTSTSQVAIRLLRVLAFRLRHNAAALPNIQHISGVFNVMADVASRKHSLDPETFLTEFTDSFPPPQNAYWTLFHFNTATTSKLFSELRLKQLPPASWLRLQKHGGACGTLGPNGYTSSTLKSHPTSHPSNTTPLPNNNFWVPTPSMCDKAAFLTENSKFEPKLSNWHSAPSPRRSFWTENKVRWKQRKEASQKPSANNWRAIAVPTLHQNPD